MEGATLEVAQASALVAAGVALEGAELADAPFLSQVVVAADADNASLFYRKLSEWLGEEGVQLAPAPRLLFRASRDGWRGADFHRCCDGRGRTLVLVRSACGQLFGGYASVPWASPQNWSYSRAPGSFLFCLTAAAAGVAPAKMRLKDQQNDRAVYHGASFGPIFGGGHDLLLRDNCNGNTNSRHTIGHTYALPPGAADYNFLTGGGNSNFTVHEYEVWQVG